MTRALLYRELPGGGKEWIADLEIVDAFPVPALPRARPWRNPTLVELDVYNLSIRWEHPTVRPARLSLGIIEAKAGFGTLVDVVRGLGTHEAHPRQCASCSGRVNSWELYCLRCGPGPLERFSDAIEAQARALFELVEPRPAFYSMHERLLRARVEDLDVDPIHSLSRKGRK